MANLRDLENQLEQLRLLTETTNSKLDALEDLVSQTVSQLQERGVQLERIANDVKKMKDYVNAHLKSIIYAEHTMGYTVMHIK